VKRAATVMLRAVGTAGTVALAGLSWHILAVLAVAVLIVVGAVCWVITDAGRSQRLAMLIRAWRGSARQKPTRSP
jgi:cell division protein FtsW (lipid II flippase)